MGVQDQADNTQTSRMRLLSAGKTLFARNGYEQTSTAAIAREAGSSESQLIRYFSGKAGLLEAIFNEAWAGLNEMVGPFLEGTQNGREAIVRVLTLMIQAFHRDQDIAFLFLFEGRRMRGHSPEVLLSKGYAQFHEIFDAQLERGRNDGSFRKDVHAHILAAAILGAAEGMMRERILAERTHTAHAFADEELVKAFEGIVGGFAPSALA